MGIFDVFKTKVSEARDKAGEAAGQAKDKVSDMMDKKKEAPGAAGDQVARGADANTEGEASNMVSEGAPVAQDGEAAPGVGDHVAAEGESAPGSRSGGMTQSIKDNVSSGVDKAGQMAKDKTGGKYDDKIDSGVRQAKDRLR